MLSEAQQETLEIYDLVSHKIYSSKLGKLKLNANTTATLANKTHRKEPSSLIC